MKVMPIILLLLSFAAYICAILVYPEATPALCLMYFSVMFMVKAVSWDTNINSSTIQRENEERIAELEKQNREIREDIYLLSKSVKSILGDELTKLKREQNGN